MNVTAIVVTALIALPLVAVLTWLGIAAARINRELGTLGRFKQMHFEVDAGD